MVSSHWLVNGWLLLILWGCATNATLDKSYGLTSIHRGLFETIWTFNDTFQDPQGHLINLHNIPSLQWQALYDLYSEGAGPIWQWPTNYTTWNFTGGYELHHPCADNWAFIVCDCTSQDASKREFAEVNTSSGRWRTCSILELHMTEVGVLGALPTSLPQLCNLTTLLLAGNSLTGMHLATVVNAFPALQRLSLAGNDLTGTFPLHGTHLHLKQVDFSKNQFVGTLPGSLSLPALEEFFLDDNALDGSIASTWFGDCQHLQVFSFPHNHFIGTLSSELEQCAQLTDLIASNNQLTGEFPVSVLSVSLNTLKLDHNLFDDHLDDMIAFLEQHSNDSVLPGHNLQVLFLDGNRFEGTLLPVGQFWSRYFPLLEALSLSDNFFLGGIPTDLCHLHKMEVLDLSGNQLTGSIPLCLSALSDLADVSLQGNQLRGKLDCAWLTASSMPFLDMFDVSSNFLSGRIDCDLFRLPDALKLLRLDANLFTGPLPLFLTLGKNIETVIVRGGMHDSFESRQQFMQRWNASQHHNSSLLTTSSLQIISIGENPFHGYFPIDWLPMYRNLHIFDGSSACFFPDDDAEAGRNFHDVMLSLCQHSPQLHTLILDGSNALCGNSQKNRLKSGTHIRNRYLPSCVFTSFPGLEKLSLAGVGIKGPFPNITKAFPSTFTTLLLTRNQLSGTIPLVVQHHPWTLLDLSYNKLRGVLAFPMNDSTSATAATITSNLSAASWNLEANRLSDEIPAVYSLEGWKYLSILQGNLFTCALDQTDLPQDDPGASTYSCGSNSLNVVLYIWCFLNVLLVLYWIYRQRPAQWKCSLWFASCMSTLSDNYSLGWSWLAGLYEYISRSSSKIDNDVDPSSASSAGCCDDSHNERLSNVQEMLRILMNLVTKSALMLLVVFIPLYLVLEHHFKTHSNTFAFKVSSAYFSGIIPAIMCYIAWLLCYVVLLHTYQQLHLLMLRSASPPATELGEDKVVSNHSSGQFDGIVWRSKSMLAMVAVTFCVALGLFMFIVLLNIAFLYTQIHFVLSVRIIFQCIMSIVKLVFGRMVIPLLFSYLMKIFLTWEHAQGKDKRIAMVSFCKYSQTFLELIFGVILNVIAPCVATAIYDINCFYDIAVQSPNRITISYEVPYCDVALADVSSATATSSQDCTYFPFFTDFSPKFQYSYLCTSALLSNYCFVFVFMVLFDGTINPLLRNLALRLLQFIADARAPKDTVPKPPPVTSVVLKLQEDNLLTVCINYLAILFTFGVTFAPLGILICVHLTVELSVSFHRITDFIRDVNSISFYEKLPQEWFVPPALQSSPVDTATTAMVEETGVQELRMDNPRVQVVRKAVLRMSERKLEHAIIGMTDMFVYVIVPMHLFVTHYFVFDIIGDVTDWPIASLVACLLLTLCLLALFYVVRRTIRSHIVTKYTKCKQHDGKEPITILVTKAKPAPPTGPIEQPADNTEVDDQLQTAAPSEVVLKDDNEIHSFNAPSITGDECSGYSYNSHHYSSFVVEQEQEHELDFEPAEEDIEEAKKTEDDVVVQIRPPSALPAPKSEVPVPEVSTNPPEDTTNTAVITTGSKPLDAARKSMIEMSLVAQAAETEEMIATIERYERMYEMGTDVITILIALVLIV